MNTPNKDRDMPHLDQSSAPDVHPDRPAIIAERINDESDLAIEPEVRMNDRRLDWELFMGSIFGPMVKKI